MLLSSCPLNTPVRVTALDFDEPTSLRMRELGLAPGATVRVSQRGGFGGRVVTLAQQRFALDGATAGRIEAELVDEVVGA